MPSDAGTLREIAEDCDFEWGPGACDEKDRAGRLLAIADRLAALERLAAAASAGVIAEIIEGMVRRAREYVIGHPSGVASLSIQQDIQTFDAFLSALKELPRP